MTGPVVAITIAPRVDGDLVEIVGTRTGDHLALRLPAGALEKARGTVAGVLRRFKDDIGPALGPPTDDVRRALRDLFMRTLLIGGSLTDGPAGMDNLRALFVAALPDWASTTDVPLVQVEGPSYGFPFELLPVFDLGDPGHMDDLGAFARRFLGFSAVVRRAPYVIGGTAGMPIEPVLKGGPLPLSFVWYAPMDGARTERQFLARLGAHVELNGPWPAPSVPLKTVLTRLAEGLVEPRRRYATAELGQEVQIQHFACHCDTGFDDPADYELELSGEDGDSSRITLGELNMAFTFGQRAADERIRPLVFLNACGSAHLDPRRVYSWPEWFLRTRHRCVIGPETLIPDHAAALYARYFYQELFAQRSAGEALVRARRTLLERYGNPLGLLYVLYGDPTITVDAPIPQEVLND